MKLRYNYVNIDDSDINKFNYHNGSKFTLAFIVFIVSFEIYRRYGKGNVLFLTFCHKTV